MSNPSEHSDSQLLDEMRRTGPKSIADLVKSTQVTANAVRQRLSRLMAQGLVDRVAKRVGRGRPAHQYQLTEKARRQGGDNFADLAMALWGEIREVKDTEIRRGLLQRIASRLAERYRGQFEGKSRDERVNALRNLLDERGIPLEVENSQVENRQLPVLTVLDCPYPDLAEDDRGICAVERMLFSEVLAEPLRLSQCRLEGHSCCQFEVT